MKSEVQLGRIRSDQWDVNSANINSKINIPQKIRTQYLH